MPEKEAAQEALNLSFLSSFRLMMYLGMGLALLSSLISLLLIEGKKPDDVPQAVESETTSA